jgi:anti-sigma B factor antagonist
VVVGELDLDTAGRVEDHVRHALSLGRAALTIDLRAVTFMDSAGVHVLLDAHGAAVDAGTALRILVGPGQVSELLALTGVDAVLDVDASSSLLAR